MMSKTYALIVAVTVALGSAARAHDDIVAPAVPEGLEVDGGFTPFFVAHAVGTQNFICATAATASGVDWVFIGPQATGFDASHEQVLSHFLSKNPDRAGTLHATWQHSRDTSAVWATRLRGSSDPAYVAPDAIEWLLLEVTGDQVGPASGDKLSSTRFIQRVHTAGGLKPPGAGCTPGTLNTRKFVDYEADYYFYR
jgi:Protein of unknown function (DUF3455)